MIHVLGLSTMLADFFIFLWIVAFQYDFRLLEKDEHGQDNLFRETNWLDVSTLQSFPVPTLVEQTEP